MTRIPLIEPDQASAEVREIYAELDVRFERPALVRLAMTVALAGMVNRIHATFQTEVDGVTQTRLERADQANP